MDALALLLAFALVALNGFFVATEFAIVKIRPTRVEELISNNRTGANTVRNIVNSLDSYLSACQLGITLASLGLGWIGEPAFAHLIEVPLGLAGVTSPEVVHGVALAAAFMTLTFLHIVVGELAPKSLAILQAESVALAVAFPMRVFHLVFFPAIWVLNSLANLLLRGLGLRSVEGPEDAEHSEDELRIILSRARSAGSLSASRGEVMRKALALSAKTARHLMIPRNEVVLLDINISTEENLLRAKESGHTRFPLCDRELDEVIGVVDVRSMLFALRDGPVDLRELAAPLAYLPEMMPAERLLGEFRARYVPMAVIVDEYGGASGIITPVDVMEAVSGEMYNNDDKDMVPLPGGAYDVDGVAPLEELQEKLRITFEVGEMRTVAGFLMRQLGRMPRPADRVSYGGYVFNVIQVNGPKVRLVRIHRETSVDTSATQPGMPGPGGSPPPPHTPPGGP